MSHQVPRRNLMVIQPLLVSSGFARLRCHLPETCQRGSCLQDHIQEVDRKEWRWVAFVAAVLTLLVAFPYGIALFRPPEGYLLARTLYYGNDLSQYLAAMGDAAASSSWLIQDHLTAEPHNPAFMYGFYVLLGKAAAFLGLTHILVFATVCLLAIPTLTFSAYSFAAAFLGSPADRRTALSFLLFASGLGIWAAILTSQLSSNSASSAFSYDRAEVSTYLLPFGPPHLALALSSLLLWGASLSSWVRAGKVAALVILAAAVIAVGVLNPFTLATMIALSGGYALASWAWTRSFPRRGVVAAAVTCIVAAPLFLASVTTFAMDPFWSVTYGRQNTTGSPAPWSLLIDFGFLVPLAVAGALYWKVPAGRRALLAFWVVWLFGLMYLPVPFQRRFGFGLQPAFAVLAAAGMAYLGQYLRGRRLPQVGLLARVAVGVGLFSGTALGYLLLIMAAVGIGPLGETIYEPRGNVDAAVWLASHSGNLDVVLASVETGNYLAGQIRGRVAVGHAAGTLGFDAKKADMKRFFDPATTPGDRLGIARAERVTLVLLGSRERSLGLTELRPEDGFSQVYDAGGVKVYWIDRVP